MRYYELLEKVNDHYLYHSTNYEAAAKILRSNILLDNTTHTTIKTINNGKRVQVLPSSTQHAYELVKGISLTRNLTFAKRWGSGEAVIFVLDSQKLRHNYKLVNIDYYGNRQEAEEFVIGSIKDINKYIIQILINIHTKEYLENYREDQNDNSYDELLNYTNLRIYK